jgi:hypothetical protein
MWDPAIPARDTGKPTIVIPTYYPMWSILLELGYSYCANTGDFADVDVPIHDSSFSLYQK